MPRPRASARSRRWPGAPRSATRGWARGGPPPPRPAPPARGRLSPPPAAAALGDGSTAADLERGLLAEHGQRLGPWVRLQVGDTLDETGVATGLWGLVAGRGGGPPAGEAAASR